MDSELSLDRAELETLLKKHASTFAKDDMDLGRAIGVDLLLIHGHRETAPKATRKVPVGNDNQIETMLKQSIIGSKCSHQMLSWLERRTGLEILRGRKLNELTVKAVDSVMPGCELSGSPRSRMAGGSNRC